MFPGRFAEPLRDMLGDPLMTLPQTADVAGADVQESGHLHAGNAVDAHVGGDGVASRLGGRLSHGGNVYCQRTFTTSKKFSASETTAGTPPGNLFAMREHGDDPAIYLGDWLAELKQRGKGPFKQTRIADAVGVSKGYISTLVSQKGGKTPSRKVVMSIAEVIGLPTADLLYYPPGSPPARAIEAGTMAVQTAQRREPKKPEAPPKAKSRKR